MQNLTTHIPGELQPVRQLLLVSPDILPQVWPQVEHIFLEHAKLWNEYYAIEHFPLMFQSGRMQLWTMNDADDFLLVMVTEIVTFPKVKKMNVLYMMGEELQDGLMFIDYLERWAWKNGVRKSHAGGRDGFQRLLEPHGYRKIAVVLEKDITEIREH